MCKFVPRERVIRVTSLAPLLLLLFVSAASAGPIHFFGELLTSNSAPLGLKNLRGVLDASFDPSATDIILNGSVTPGAGIGDGYVPAFGNVTYFHRFEPSAIVASVLSASLLISTVDDQLFDATESVAITLDSQFWASGRATFSVFGGHVSTRLFQGDGQALVAVSSTRGDVNVVASLFTVQYDAAVSGGGGAGADTVSAVPEPGAMALFAAGLGVVGIATRRTR